MKSRYLFCTFALLASACTIAPQQGGNMETSLNLPLTYHHWQTERYTNQNGAEICSVSSGYNGLTVVLRHQADSSDVFVRGDRIMQPGVTLTVNVNGHSFETYDTYFPAKLSHELVENFKQGGKAYLEWSEIGGTTGEQHIHTQNILQLDDFAAKLKECQGLLYDKQTY